MKLRHTITLSVLVLSEVRTVSQTSPGEAQNSHCSGDGSHCQYHEKTDKYVEAHHRTEEETVVKNIMGEVDKIIRQAGAQMQRAIRDFVSLLHKRNLGTHTKLKLGKALEARADQLKSAPAAAMALVVYEQILLEATEYDDLHVHTVARMAQRSRSKPWKDKTVMWLKKVFDQRPDRLELRSILALTLFELGNKHEAASVLEQELKKNPSSGITNANYGLILSLIGEDHDTAVKFMRKGMASKESGTQDKTHFVNLGKSLIKLGRRSEADEVHKLGVQKGVFVSSMQRGDNIIRRLTAKPFWTIQETGHEVQFKRLEDQWRVIRDEGLALLNSGNEVLEPDDQNLALKGQWDKLTLYDKGGTTVVPHCGPTNHRIRSHLGLVLPPNARISVLGDTRSWVEGKFIVIDDSLEHEVWNAGTEPRIILIIDFWHPEMTAEEKS